MSFQDLDGIANVQYAHFGFEDITFEGQQVWDDAADRRGVVTRDIGVRQADEVRMGYDPEHPILSEKGFAYWTLDEDAEEFEDHIGGAGTAYNEGTTPGDTGILGGRAPHAEGESYVITDYNIDSDQFGGSGGAVAFWAYHYDFISSNHIGVWDSPRLYIGMDGDGDIQYGYGDDWNNPSTNNNTGEWIFMGMSNNGSTTYAYVNGEQVDSESSSFSGSNQEFSPVNVQNNLNENDMLVSDVILFDDYVTESEFEELYETAVESYLETATESFTTPRTPDLIDLDYELNGETVEIDVIGSPGTTDEEVATQELDGDTQYQLSWDTAHSDYRVRPVLSTSDVEETPKVNSITLRG